LPQPDGIAIHFDIAAENAWVCKFRQPDGSLAGFMAAAPKVGLILAALQQFIHTPDRNSGEATAHARLTL
jgi:hypothetical protein